ncbi:MAG: cytidylate kinase family protein [Gemmatimonadales bacterium]|jgi:hypothetical protein|nr:cytidylate kinase family protein [Gemmatimonadales bacterium]
MTIITISRGVYGGVEPLVDLLAKRTGSRTLSREQLLADAAAEWGASESQLQSALMHRPGLFEGRGLSKLHFIACAQATMAKAARGEGLVYHGEAGHLLLKGVPHHLRVRVIANQQQRVETVMARCDLSREKAIEYVRTLDAERDKWGKWVHGIDTGDAALFDLVINLERLTAFTAADIILEAAGREFQATPESRRVLDDLVIESEVRARIGLDPSIPDERMSVSVRDGVVTIHGSARYLSHLERAAEVARKIAGVARVESESP